MKPLATAASLLLFAAGPACAGLTVVMEEGKTRSTAYIESNKIRMEDADSGGHNKIMIFDGDAKLLTVVSPKRKTYSQTNEADMKAAGAQMQDSMAKAQQQMQAAMSKMTPEQRQQMEAMTAQHAPQHAGAPEKEQVKYEPTSEKNTIAGFSCQGYREIRGNRPRSEGCYIPWSSGAVSKDDLKPLFAFGEFFAAMLPPGSRHSEHVMGEFSDAPGFPALRTEIDSNGKRGKEKKLVSFTRGSVTADKFEPPAGYNKSAKGGFLQGGED